MLKLCFYQRLAISLVSVFILVVGVFVYASATLQHNTRLEAEQRLHVDLAAHLVNDNPLLAQGVYDYSALKNLFHTLMVMGPSFEFYYLDPDGKILSYASELGELARDSVELQPITDFLRDAASLPILGNDPRHSQRSKIFSVAPVVTEQGLQGYIYIIIGGQAYDSILANLKRSAATQQFAIFAAAALIFLLVALLVLFKAFTRPMKQLSDDMDTVRDASFDANAIAKVKRQWRRTSHNEIHRLGCAFNDMMEHITVQFDRLQQTDIQRRVLLADLSHDLRTPLANLQGYIETLDIQNDTLSADERKRFIEISLKNAGNLKRLIEQIFELAYLEAGQVTLTQEAFSVAELLHDVAATFSGQLTSKNIALRVKADAPDLFVHADIGKVERIVANLLDNAIRHTPEDGQIELVLTRQETLACIEVKDTGNGIAESELAFIFAARYQAANQCSDDRVHVGLGLAICQKLTALMRGEISVSSQVGRGTVFSLSLPLAP
ncbi:sensor histidine kinase [Alteromonas flava]|uniref:sensor histidine kinase n=1 Tax=Alteromonas flava TaxID=2048003 RepID=UPI001F0B81B6|nr:HAMP domain-containing sensor histidine kinase [Alteromonas flava]